MQLEGKKSDTGQRKKQVGHGTVPTLFLIKTVFILAGVAQWIEHWHRTKESPVRFPVRAHAWVASQVGHPVGGT